MDTCTRWLVRQAFWIGAVACALPSAAAPVYSFTALDIAGAASFQARALNDAGQVVGSTSNEYGPEAALWSDGVGVRLPPPAGTLGSQAYAINASGQVPGTASIGMGRYQERGVVWSGAAGVLIDPLDRAFGINAGGALAGEGPARSFFVGPLSFSNGVATELGASGGLTGSAYAINDAGQVVGFNGDQNEQPRATLWSGADVVDLGVSGTAYAINAQGQVVGVSWDEPTARAFLWSVLGLVWLDAPGASGAAARSINDLGQIVGASTDAALLWSEGTRYDLNDLLAPGALDPGWVLTSAADINNKGWIVGEATDAQTGATRSYLLTPLVDNAVPEPQSLALVLLALGALAWRRRRA